VLLDAGIGRSETAKRHAPPARPKINIGYINVVKATIFSPVNQKISTMYRSIKQLNHKLSEARKAYFM